MRRQHRTKDIEIRLEPDAPAVEPDDPDSFQVWWGTYRDFSKLSEPELIDAAAEFSDDVQPGPWKLFILDYGKEREFARFHITEQMDTEGMLKRYAADLLREWRRPPEGY